MNRDEIVERVTSRGVQFLLACIQGGLEDYDTPSFYSAEAKRDHTPPVAATCRNCHIIGRAKRATVEMADLVKTRQSRGRITFVFADHTEVWFKKVDDRGRPSHRASEQALEFVGPTAVQAALNITMPPPIERWVAGYRPTTAADTAYEVVVTGPEAAGTRWEVPLSGAEVRDLFSQPEVAPAAAEVIKKRVRIRRDAKGKDATGESNA